MEAATQNSSEALAVRQSHASPTLYEGSRDLTAFDVVHQVRTVQEVMEAVMKPDIHYGNIPGCDKPSLLQPGAEKLAMVFRLAIKPEVEDLSQNGEAHFRCTAELTHIPTGRYVGTGIGECSTFEEKYAWKRAVCDAEYEYVEQRKGADFVRLKFGMKKRGTYKKDEPDYYTSKQVRTNPADLRNTILQMAIKRAVVSGVKRATAASDVFAQNLEDLPEEYREMVAEVAPEIQAPQRKSDAEKPMSEKLADAFKLIDVNPAMLEEYLGHPLAALTDEELGILRGVYSAIRVGEITWGRAMDIRREQSAPKQEAPEAPKPEPVIEKPAAEPPKAEAEPEPTMCTFKDEYGECVLSDGHDGPHETMAMGEPQYIRVITDDERRKLFGAMTKAKPKAKPAKDWETESRKWIKDTYGFETTAAITFDKYPAILAHFENYGKK